jgi:hypothetical protein
MNLRAALFVPALALLAGTAPAQETQKPEPFGEVIDVRTGFVRITLPAGAPAPSVGDIEVLWRKQPQKILRVIGGTKDPLEVGIAVDRSASMHASFEPMRAAALELVDQGISDQDRVFAVAFTDETRLLAEGRGEAARVLRALPATPESGSHPTALFDAIKRTLQLFQNADARAALIVVSDGCDTAGGLVSATSAARRASDLAIPIFLLMPNRADCENTECVQDLTGAWKCSPAQSKTIIAGSSNDMFNPASRTMDMAESSKASAATAERDRFTGLIARTGGDFVARDADDWQRALVKIFERLGRQWTVVFEPSSDEVRSDEIKVYSTAGGRRRRLE